MAVVVIAFISALVALLGARLLVLARRTREAPEALLSVFFLAGAAGMFLRLLGAGSELPQETARVITLSGHTILTLGMIAAVAFARSVFRARARWGRWVARALSIALVVSCAALFVPGYADEDRAAVFVANVSRILPFAWLFAESLGQYLRMRRQARLALGDPVVTNRFLLWSIWTGLLAALPIVVIGFRIASRVAGESLAASQQHSLGQIRIILLLAAVGITCSVWLSFFPPHRYVDRIRIRRSEQSPRGA